MKMADQRTTPGSLPSSWPLISPSSQVTATPATVNSVSNLDPPQNPRKRKSPPQHDAPPDVTDLQQRTPFGEEAKQLETPAVAAVHGGVNSTGSSLMSVFTRSNR